MHEGLRPHRLKATSRSCFLHFNVSTITNHRFSVLLYGLSFIDNWFLCSSHPPFLSSTFRALWCITSVLRWSSSPLDFRSSRKSKFNHECCYKYRSKVDSGLRLDTLRHVKFAQRTHLTHLLQLNTHFQKWSIRQQHSLTRINLILLCFCLRRSRFFLPLMIKRSCWAFGTFGASSPFYGHDQWQRRFSWRSLSSSPHVLFSYWATPQWRSLIICSHLDLPFLPMSHVRVLLFLAQINGRLP